MIIINLLGPGYIAQTDKLNVILASANNNLKKSEEVNALII